MKNTKEASMMAIFKNLYYRAALVLSSVLCAVLFVNANTGSCMMIHQPEAPKNLDRFSKIK